MDIASATRSEAEVALILAEFERRHDVFGVIVEGISLWRILRFEISYVMQKLGLPRLSASRQEIIATIFESMRQIVTAPREIEYLGATMNSALRIFDERGWHDVYFDAVMDQIGGGAKMLYADARGFEDNVRHAYRKPVFNDTARCRVQCDPGPPASGARRRCGVRQALGMDRERSFACRFHAGED